MARAWLVMVGAGVAAIALAIAPESQGAPMAEVRIDSSWNHKSVSVPAGGTLSIELPENATTGYRWSVEPCPEAILKESGDKTRRSSGAVGSGGARIFSFDAAGKGSCELSLKLWREWEGEKSIRERFQVKVRVSAK